MDGARRAREDISGRDGGRRVSRDAGQDRQVELPCQRFAGNDRRRSAVAQARSVAGSDSAPRAKRGSETAQRFQRGVRANRLIDGDDGHSPLAGHLDGDDLVSKTPGLRRFLRSHVAVVSELILRLTADVIALRNNLRFFAHVDVLDGAPEAVVDDRIHRGSVAHTKAGAGLRQQIGRVAHALHAAGDIEVPVAGFDRLSGQHDGFQAGATHQVDGHGGNVVRHARAQLRLTSGRLALAC